MVSNADTGITTLMQKVLTIVIGSGGHAMVVVDALVKTGQVIDFIYDHDSKKLGVPFERGLVVQLFPELAWWKIHQTKSIIAIGSNSVRKEIVSHLNNSAWLQSIHPTALIHETAVIGQGVYIGANVTIQPHVKIGNHSIINTGSIIEHDCSIGEYCHIAPGVILTGNVSIDEGAFIGARTVVIPNKQIGKWTIIGAGSVVTKNIQSHRKAFGAPLRIMKLIESAKEY